ncbi:hypothetical protein ACFLWS_05375 [Chloroflexota bacterium]
MMEHTFGMIGDLCRAFYEKNGKEALLIITEVASKGGVERAEIMQKMTLEERAISIILLIWWALGDSSRTSV